MTFAQKAILFHQNLEFRGKLPDKIRIMNPYREDPIVMDIVKEFFMKFYNDTQVRHLIIGINPGRHGAGITGIPFTDTIRLEEQCGIRFTGVRSFEPSSVFIYDMIKAYGGLAEFFSGFYISAVVPLGFTAPGKNNDHVNYNYYDDPALLIAVKDFIIRSIRSQLQFGISDDVCFCLGTGKNFRFLEKLNEKEGFFKSIVPLEHPRYIMQYKSKKKEQYIDKYVKAFRNVKGVI